MVSQCAEECDHGSTIVAVEIDSLRLSVVAPEHIGELGVIANVAIVEIEHGVEVGEPAVVHVGRGEGDVAK